MESAPRNTATNSKINVSHGGERVCDTTNGQGPNPSRLDSLAPTRGASTEFESKPEAAHSKDRASRWTDENGKMAIQSDVFDPILPSADEVLIQELCLLPKHTCVTLVF